MAEKSDEIRDRIDAQRGELGDNLHELERRVKSTTDWRAHMENRPWIMLGIAFGTGVAISGLISRSGGSSSYSSAYSGGYSDTSSKSSSSRFTAVREQRSRAAESLDKMTGALIAVGVQKLQDVLCSAIPGFTDKYQSADSSQSSQTSAMGDSSYRGSEYDRPQTEYSQAPTPAL